MNPGFEVGDTGNVVRECLGFRRRTSHTLCHHLLLAAAGWLAWMLTCFAPCIAAHLLEPCTLHHAVYALVKLLDGRQYMLQVHTAALQNPPGHGRSSVGNSRKVRTFQLFLRTYVYIPEKGMFEPVPGMPHHLPHQICQALHALQQIDTKGADWTHFNVVQRKVRNDMVQTYGNEKTLIPPRNPLHLAGPMGPSINHIFHLQLLELVYLIYQGQFLYPILISIFTVPAVHGMATVLNQQHGKVMALMNESRLMPMVQEKLVRAIASHRLVPGDVTVLHKGRALCDMVMLRGACLVTESVLSGETEQLQKSGYVPVVGKEYDPDWHRSCTIYAGSMVQQVWNPESSEDEVLAMICRTGFNTAMGKTVRELLAPIKVLKEKNPVAVDIGLLYLFALALQFCILIPYLMRFSEYHESMQRVVGRLLNMGIFAVPPGLPLVLLLIGAAARSVLKKDGLLLLFPEIIKHGAAVDMVCFDKTGTLTDKSTKLHGVLPVHQVAFAPLQQSAVQWTNRLKQSFAVCHNLNMVNKSTVAGTDMERSLFKAVEARFLDKETVVLPRRPNRVSSSPTVKLSILKRFEFSSQALRSGVVVQSQDAPPGSALLFLRGAPAVIRTLVNPATVPGNFDQVVDDYSSKSFRLLAGALGSISHVHKKQLPRMTQQQVEACATDMQLLSLIVLTNSVRQDSRDTISQLQDGGGMRTMMITGDYHHTAIAVARDVGMVRPQGQVVVIDTIRPCTVDFEHQVFSSHRHDRLWAQHPDLRTSPQDARFADPRASSASQGPSKDASHLIRGPRVAALQNKRVTWAPLPEAEEPSQQLQMGALQPPGHAESSTLSVGSMGFAEALGALAEGQTQCAVTGNAFQDLLQHGDLSVLETVMRSAVVFARMQPHQKGQVVDLLSTRGIHQLFDGQPRHIQGLGQTTMFCGDGINDLVALSAADVGMAIGTNDAVIAAELFSSIGSVAGVSSFIKVSKGAWAMLTSLFQYMVVYQCIVAEANSTAFFVDGSSMSNLQMGLIDLQAMGMALASCWVAPLKQLNRHKPPSYTCTLTGLIRLASAAISLQMTQISLMAFLCTRPWFVGGNGTANMNPVMSAAWLMANLQLLAPLLSLTLDTRRFCEPVLRSRVLAVIAVIYTAMSYVGLVVRPSPKFNLLHLYNFTQTFRIQFGLVAAAAFVAYVAVMQCTRIVLGSHQQRRIQTL